MPYKCIVPNCRSNYAGGPKHSVFKFPNDPDLKREWLKAIQRKDSSPNNNSRVCEVHFLSEQVEKFSENYNDENGKLTLVPLDYPRLKKDAVPSVFTFSVANITMPKQQVRKDPNDQKLKREMKALETALAESIETAKQYEKSKCFSNLKELRSCIEADKSMSWDVIYKPECIIFVKMLLCPLSYEGSILVSKDLDVSAVLKNNLSLKKVGAFSFPCKVSSINEINSITDAFDKMIFSPTTDSMSVITEIVNNLKNSYPDNSNLYEFLLEQITNSFLPNTKHQYSSNMLIFACLFHSISPHAYKFVRSTKNLI